MIQSIGDRCAVWRLGLFLELPFDAGVPDGSTFSLQDADVLEGWQGVGMAPLPHLRPHVEDGLRPTTGFHFKRARLEEDFGAALRQAFPIAIAGPVRVPSSRSAVQITRLDAAPPGGEGERGDWVSDQFDAALAKLNDFLVLVGQMSGDPHVRPVDELELPAVVPYLLTDLERNPDGVVGPDDRHLLVLHPGVPYEAGELSEERLHRAVRLMAVQHSRGHPFFAFAEAILAARNALVHGRTRQAALDAGTAVEVLVNAVLREVGPVRGHPPDKVARIVALVGLKNQLVEHVGPLLRTDVRLDDPDNPFGRWFRGAYALRNRVSHEGYRPTSAEAGAALDDVDGFVRALTDALGADPATREIGAHLSTRLE